MKYIRRPFSLIALIAAFAALFAPMTASAGDVADGGQRTAAGGDYTAFRHVATFGNILADATAISDPLIDNDPGARVVVTPSSSFAKTAPVGVYYDWSSGRWMIFNQDGSLMSDGAAYNVYLNGSIVTHDTSQSNTEFDWTIFDNPLCTGRENAQLVVTPVWSSTGYHNHHVGAVYTSLNRWAIQNIDGATMPAGMRFNVLVAPSDSFAHVVKDRSVAHTTIASSLTDNNPDAQIFVTPVYTSLHPSTMHAGSLGVVYSYGRWHIYTLDASEMQVGEAYSVAVVTPPVVEQFSFRKNNLIVDARNADGSASVLVEMTQQSTKTSRKVAGRFIVRGVAPWLQATPVYTVRVRTATGLMSRAVSNLE